MKRYRILWADDEIDMLKSHIIFLTDKGFDVTTASNGEDAIALSQKESYDIIFLDEQMPGIGGLGALSEIKATSPSTPVIMITKNEEESLMDQAIGKKISDYLIKPVNPNQIVLACKKLLDSESLKDDSTAKDYISEFNKITQQLMMPMEPEDWMDLHARLSKWELELDEHPNLDLRETLTGQKRDCNAEFSKYVERHYETWCESEFEEHPTLSVDILDKHVVPHLKDGKKVFFFVVDCLRYDQWLIMATMLQSCYQIHNEQYFSILPTATSYARNTIFSGLFPDDIEKRHPKLWAESQKSEHSKNKYEDEFFKDFFKRRRLSVNGIKYSKLTTTEESKNFENSVLSYLNHQLNAVVINFVDILAHSRFDSQVIRELSPDENAFRSLTKTWFEHSYFFKMLKALAKQDVTIVVTTDHGSIRCMHPSKVIGDREASTNLRFKFGKNLQCETKQAVMIRNPERYRLPKHALNIHYIIAKEDYYFVYPTNYHKFVNQYRDSFQHGGISLDEMVVPIATLTPKV